MRSTRETLEPAESDLFRPVLDAEDDAGGFSEPWNPQHLLVLTFFAGGMAGGWIFGLNARRLGSAGGTSGRLLGPALLFAVGLLGPPLLYVALAALLPLLSADPGLEAFRRSVRIGSQVLFVAAAFPVSRSQGRRFRLFEASGGRPGGLLGPAVLALALGILMQVAVMVAVVALLGEPEL